MKKFGKKRKLEKMTVNAYACQCSCNCSCNCSCACNCNCNRIFYLAYGMNALDINSASNSQVANYRAGAAGGMGGGLGMNVAGGYM